MKHKFKRTVSSLSLCSLLVLSAVPAFAAEDVPTADTETIQQPDKTETSSAVEMQTGTITVSYLYDSIGISNAKFSIYKVAERREHLSLAFQLIDALSDLDVNITEPDSKDISKLNTAITEKNLFPAGTAETNSSGQAVFHDVEEGLYLLIQTNSLDNYELTSPSLIAIPSEDGSYSMTAEPKAEHSLETTDTPPTSSSPKTGVDAVNYTFPAVISAVSCVLLAVVTFIKRKFTSCSAGKK